MKRCPLILAAFLLNPHLASAADPAKPTTQAALVESKPAVKDGVSITIALKQPAISTSDQPQLIVRFTNTAADYINLYDVNAYCDWEIAFTPAHKQAELPRPWILKMDKLPHRIPLAHLQIKPTESLEVPINLNDPPFTFHYENAKPADRAAVPSIRHLAPGNYQVAMTIKLTNPFGEGYHLWTGPLTTEPVELVVGPPNPDQNADPTPEQAAAYSAAIRRLNDKLHPSAWLNGGSPEINLSSDAKPEDVIEAAVNRTILESKVYRILKQNPSPKPECRPTSPDQRRLCWSARRTKSSSFSHMRNRGGGAGFTRRRWRHRSRAPRPPRNEVARASRIAAIHRSLFSSSPVL